MATRSGKTYQESKKSRRRNNINNTSATTSPNGKYTDNNLDISNIYNGDLSMRRSSVKNSTFDKIDLPMTKTSIDNATESNWIVSDLSSKENERWSSNKPISSTTYKNINKKSESYLDTSNMSTKQLRKRALHSSDNNFYKSDQIINVTDEKDEMHQNDVEMTAAMKERNSKKLQTYDKDKTVEKGKADIHQDTENDLNSLNVGKILKQKKKKGKSSRKKKQKGKLKPDNEESPDNVKILNTTFDKDNDVKDSISKNIDLNNSNTNMSCNSLNLSNIMLRRRKSGVKDTTEEKEDILINTTYEKDEIKDRTFDKDSDPVDISNGSMKRNKSSITLTFNKNDNSNYTFEIDKSIASNILRKSQNNSNSSIKDVSLNTSISRISKEIFEKEKSALSSPATKRMSLRRQTVDIIPSPVQKLNTTFDKSELETETKRRSRRLSTAPSVEKLNVTFDKDELEDNPQNSKSSLISSDNSSVSRVSITSDESTENIVNTTPVLIESSMDESRVKDSSKQSGEKLQPLTPLKREGTFTKEAPEVELPQTPGKESDIMPAAGCTPYHISKSSQKKPMLNVTRSIEKRLSVDPGHRMTRVMFCSPIDNPTSVAQEKRKIIKSNLKGSNKSFVFDESLSITRSARKRSYTQNDADDARIKRSRLADDLQQSVDRLSRPRTPSTTTKLGDTTPKKSNTPYKSKSETKPARTRLPNFAMLHQKQFDKMESLGECQERKAKRAKQMLTPSAPKNAHDKISPKNNADSQKTSTKEPVKPKEKTEFPSKKPLTLESLRPGFTRFGFKLNLDINPFSIPSKKDKPKDKLNGIVSKPSLTGATLRQREASERREAAKQTVMREKSFVEKRKMNRSENRTIIKGVRTNRRFELQMKLRNID